MRKLDVLVTGSTGRQGGAVAHALLRGGHHVRAMTRNLAHPAANALRLRGARLAWANLDDERRVREALAGADAVFAVAPRVPPAAVAAADTEAADQVLRLADLARQESVPHFVFSTGAAPGPHADGHHAHHETEHFLRAMRVPHTVLRPAFLMENLLAPWLRARLEQGELPLPVPAGHSVQQLALADLGRFVRLVLERRDEFMGTALGVASDELTPVAMAATLARVLGRGIRCTEKLGDAPNDVATAAVQRLPADTGTADVPGLRRGYPEVDWHTLDGWARRQAWTRASAGAQAPERPTV